MDLFNKQSDEVAFRREWERFVPFLNDPEFQSFLLSFYIGGLLSLPACAIWEGAYTEEELKQMEEEKDKVRLLFNQFIGKSGNT